MPESIEIVDKDNRLIGTERRDIVHSKGLFHRTVNIFVFNPKGVFLQKRSPDKDICPSCWDLSVAEHLKPGEPYKEAAVRGLKEELGITSAVSLLNGIHLQKNEYLGGKIKDYEFVELYKTTYVGDIVLQKSEVSEGRFFPISKVKRMVKESPGQFTPWFLEEWKFLEITNLI